MILNEGEVVCDECNGKGNEGTLWTCAKCDGKGKLDWVTNAMGNNSTWGIIRGQATPCPFHGAITIDVNEGVSGTTYPIGTSTHPVNNLSDAKKIAKERGLC